MPLVSKTVRREHSFEIIAIILNLRNLEKLFDEITIHLQLLKSIIISIVHQLHRQKIELLRSTKRVDQLLKLNARDKRHLIRHVELNLHDDFAALTSPSKTEKFIHRIIVCQYLKKADYSRFSAKKKSYLISKHKLTRLK